MIAALSLYDWPEVGAETDALWAALAARLRARGFDAPAALDRGYRMAEDSDALLFGQVCGLPHVRGVAPRTRMVATPCYAVAGCDGPFYSSAVIVGKGDRRGMAALREGRLAANDPGSMSGWLAALAEIGGEPAEVLWTGAHRESVRAVAAGRADAATIDAMAFDLALRFEREAAAEVEVVGWTRRLPAPLYVTAQPEAAAAEIRAALDETLADPALAPALHALRLTCARALREADYDPIRRLAAEHAARLGAL